MAQEFNMGRDDWFRRRTWTDADRSEFFARLNKSRSAFHKAQYVRIQALELHHFGGKRYASTALELLDLILQQWKTEADASIHLQRAECLRDLGDDAAALVAYRAAFDDQRQRRRGIAVTTAHLDFAWWVATSPKPELFDEAFRILEEFSHENGITFQFETYMANGSRALIYNARGNHEQAVIHARRAIEAANAQHSGLRYHPTVGLAQVQDRKAHETLTQLASI
jgi:tetratricopeptide (TPR) repeat protein